MKTIPDVVAKTWCFIFGHWWVVPNGADYKYCTNCGEYHKGIGR